MMKINVHGGHNSHSTGASCYLNELTEDRKVKNEVIRLLKGQGHTVYDCTDDAGTSQSANLKNIVSKCNAHSVDLDVSIHLNAGGGTGTEVYVYSSSSKAKSYAQRIANNIANDLGIKNRGVKENSSLYVLKHTSSPALLIECCFVDSQNDKAKWNYQKCAQAIVKGILNKSTLAQQTQTPSTVKSYLVKVTANVLNVRKGAGTNYPIATQVKKGEVYTIVGEVMNGSTKWGKLKSGAGYISLAYTQKV